MYALMVYELLQESTMQLQFCLKSASFASSLSVYSVNCNHPFNDKKQTQHCSNAIATIYT